MYQYNISIVIPAYNVEKYLERCVVSCLNQDLNKCNYEIIIVNDGSTDDSLNIAKNLAENNDNIHVISQENGGLSSARNKGLKMSQGEYVWFVDSDDWIEEKCLSMIISQCNSVDVLCLSYIKTFENGSSDYVIMPPLVDDNTGTSLFLTKKFCTPAQFYIYRKEFLIENDLKFYEGVFHEDMEFTPRMLCRAKTIRILTSPVYYYFIRENSITTTVNPKKSYDLLKVANSLSSFSSCINDKEVEKSFSYYISICINNALALTNNYTKDIINEFSLTLAKNSCLFKHLRKSPLIKNKIEGFLFSLFPHKSVLIYKLFQIIH